MYLLTADIWICWFGHFAFVKPSSLHLQTSNINALFGASLDFSQNNLCIFQLQLVYSHLSEFVVFFTAHQSEFTRPTHFHSAISTEWCMVMDKNIWWWVVDEGMEHRWKSPVCICRQVISTFVSFLATLLAVRTTLGTERTQHLWHMWGGLWVSVSGVCIHRYFRRNLLKKNSCF